MIETDAPYLTPKNIEGGIKPKRNEPAFLYYVAKKVAELKGVSIESLNRKTNENVQALFQWSPE
jgi:TatD DNase family protein